MVEKAGSQAAAARQLGIPRTTFQAWLDPEANRRRHLRWYYANHEYAKARSRRYHHANREQIKAQQQDYYYSLDAVQYSRKRLKDRRWHAQRRMEKRNQEVNGGSLPHEES